MVTRKKATEVATEETKTYTVNTDGINLGSMGKGFLRRGEQVELPPGSPVVLALVGQGKLLAVNVEEAATEETS